MITYIHLHIAYWFDEFHGPNTVDKDMVGIRLWFVQNTHIFHYMTQIQLRDRQHICQVDSVVVTTVYANLMTKLQILILCLLRSLIAFEDLQWFQKLITVNCRYNYKNM